MRVTRKLSGGKSTLPNCKWFNSVWLHFISFRYWLCLIVVIHDGLQWYLYRRIFLCFCCFMTFTGKLTPRNHLKLIDWAARVIASNSSKAFHIMLLIFCNFCNDLKIKYWDSKIYNYCCYIISFILPCYFQNLLWQHSILVFALLWGSTSFMINCNFKIKTRHVC